MIQKVVGIAFIEDGKLLIVQSLRSSKTNSWTFVGGGVEERGNFGRSGGAGSRRRNS